MTFVPLRHWLRYPLAALLVAAALAHVPVVGEHLHEATYMGVAFVVFIAACVAAALRLAVRDTAADYVAVGALCVGALATYAATRLVSFPQLADDVGNWTETWGVVSVATEAVAVAAAAVAVRWARGQHAAAPAE